MPFTEASLKFLRGLKRNNDREWFNQRKPLYEQNLKAPMLALIEEVNHGIAPFAPDFLRPPHKILFRIFRDTRFSADKRPYKTHTAAWWGATGMSKTSGAGLYFSLDATEITLAAGIFMPTPDQLLALRRHIVLHHADLRRILASKRLRAVFPELEANPLTRPPKGFSPTDPAVAPALDLLLHRRWGVAATLPAVNPDDPDAGALTPLLGSRIIAAFRLALPLIQFLNTPIRTAASEPSHPSRKPMF